MLAAQLKEPLVVDGLQQSLFINPHINTLVESDQFAKVALHNVGLDGIKVGVNQNVPNGFGEWVNDDGPNGLVTHGWFLRFGL
jgi:hypothetical protein